MTAILQAAAEVIVDQGYDRASTNRIATRAGVSIGSLYQYFPNKESILVALRAEHMRQVGAVVERFLTRLDDPAQPLADALRVLFHELMETHAVDPRLSRALSRETPHPAGAAPHGNGGMMARVEAALRRRPDVRVRDYTIAAHLLTQATGSLSRWLVHDAPDDLDVEAFVDDAVAMLAGYTTTTGPSSPIA